MLIDKLKEVVYIKEHELYPRRLSLIVMNPETLRKIIDEVNSKVTFKDASVHLDPTKKIQTYRGCKILRSVDVPEGEFEVV